MTTEEAAILLDRNAVLRVVGSLRTYRRAAESLLARRYSDGEVDAAAMSAFIGSITEAEEVLIDEAGELPAFLAPASPSHAPKEKP